MSRGTLLLRLAGPMQSWGTQSRFSIRDTGLEPSKSGVVGLLCAALGRPRSESVDDLAALRMGVRVDFEGALRLDYHTVGGVHRQGDEYGVRSLGGSLRPVISHRYYLADADFLVGLEGELDLLERLHRALAEPVWQFFLGRKAFVPGVPVHVPGGLKPDVGVEAALAEHPWPREDIEPPPPQHRPARLRLSLEADAAVAGDVRRDQPVGTAFRDRSFALRHVVTRFLELGTQVPVRGG